MAKEKGERVSFWYPDMPNGRVIDYTDKESIVGFYFRHYMMKCQSMFEWKGLPETVPQRDMEMLIQHHGYGIFLEHNGKYYCLFGHAGGRRDFDYMPTLATVANPYIKDVNGAYRVHRGYEITDEYYLNDIDYKGECVIIANDPMWIGLSPLINMYANRLADTYITRHVATVNMRAMNVFYANNENTYSNVKAFIESLEKGELAAIRAEKGFEDDGESLGSIPFMESTSRVMTDLIEAEQYDKASLNNELGLNSNYNMKREAINSDESQLNVDALMPFVDAMLVMRKRACEIINKTFGLNMSVEFASSWKLSRDAAKQSNQLDQDEGEEQQEAQDDSDSSFGVDDSDERSGGDGSTE